LPTITLLATTWRSSTPLTSIADPSAPSLSANVLFTNVVTPVEPPQKNPPPHPPRRSDVRFTRSRAQDRQQDTIFVVWL
jgi:hypothetical protein